MKTPAASASPGPRVGYVLKMFPRLSETFILNEILELERHGVPLQIFSMKRPADAVVHEQTRQVRSPIIYLPEKIRDAPFRIAFALLYVRMRYRRGLRLAFRNAFRRARAEHNTGTLLALCQACCIVREMRDVRHFHAHYANVPAKLALIVHRLTGLSYSITTHAKDIFQNDPFASPKLLERLGHSRFIVANSRFSAGHIRAALGGSDKVEVVYNGLCLDSFPMRKTEPVQPLILSAGRLVPKKGFLNLVQACALLRDRAVPFTCELVGTGPLSQEIKDLVRTHSLHDRVRLLGALPQNELRRRYEAATVFALACAPAPDGDRDILPNVVKEAMAVGVPVVTTRLDGIEELIEDGVNGCLVEPNAPDALADRLECILGDGALRKRIAVEARKTVEQRFDRRINFGRLRDLLLEVLQNPAPETQTESPAERVEDEPRCFSRLLESTGAAPDSESKERLRPEAVRSP